MPLSMPPHDTKQGYIDEIVKLWVEIERLRALRDDASAECERLRAVEQRLLAALQEIADLDPATADVLTDDVGPMARGIAIRALKSNTGG